MPQSQLHVEDHNLHFLHDIDQIQADFGLMKVKLFSPSGEILYSTDKVDISVLLIQVNRHHQLRRQVM
jgi:hypothetical protein